LPSTTPPCAKIPVVRKYFFFVVLPVLLAQPANEKATSVAELFKAANMFPKSNRIADLTGRLTESEKSSGALSAANIESSHVAGVTIKVYRSITERNNARLLMVKECPGCNMVTECGAILVYTPFVRAISDVLYDRSQEYFTVMAKRYHCK
jgi:hypothetical protein